MRAIAFDLDNTIVRSVCTDDEVLMTVRRFGAGGQPAALMDLIAGAMSDWDIVCRCLAPPVRQAAYGEILRVNAAAARASYCDPAVRDLLCALASEFRLFIASGRDAASIQLILEAHDLRRCFTDIAAAAPGSEVKPAPPVLTEMLRRHAFVPQETLCIGDRLDDLEMAQRAGAAFLGAALYVDRLPPSVPIVRSVPELADAIRTIAAARATTAVMPSV